MVAAARLLDGRAEQRATEASAAILRIDPVPTEPDVAGLIAEHIEPGKADDATIVRRDDRDMIGRADDGFVTEAGSQRAVFPALRLRPPASLKLRIRLPRE